MQLGGKTCKRRRQERRCQCKARKKHATTAGENIQQVVHGNKCQGGGTCNQRQATGLTRQHTLGQLPRRKSMETLPSKGNMQPATGHRESATSVSGGKNGTEPRENMQTISSGRKTCNQGDMAAVPCDGTRMNNTKHREVFCANSLMSKIKENKPPKFWKGIFFICLIHQASS